MVARRIVNAFCHHAPVAASACERARFGSADAEAVGGQEIDLREDPWFSHDLAGGFVVEGGWTLDSMSATTAMAEAARRAGCEFRLGCEAKRILVEGDRVRGLATDDGVFDSGDLAAGQTFSFTLDDPGTYWYFCRPHPFMRARIVVAATAPTPADAR